MAQINSNSLHSFTSLHHAIFICRITQGVQVVYLVVIVLFAAVKSGPVLEGGWVGIVMCSDQWFRNSDLIRGTGVARRHCLDENMNP